MTILHRDVGHQNVILSLAFSPDGTRILSGSWDGTAKIWNVTSGALVRTFAWGAASVNAVAWSPDGAMVAVAGERPDVALSEAELESYQAYFDRCDRTFFDSPGERTGPVDEVRLFDAHDGRLLKVISGVGHGVAFSPDARAIAVSSWDCISIVDLMDGARLNCPFDDDSTPSNLYYSADGRLLACLGYSGVKVLDTGTGAWQPTASDPHLIEIELEPARVARFWQNRLSSFRPTSFCESHYDWHKVIFSPDGAQVAFTLGDVVILNAATLEVERTLILPRCRGMPPRAMAFSQDGRLLALAGETIK